MKYFVSGVKRGRASYCKVTKEEVEKILHEYIRDNLTVELYSTHDYYDSFSLEIKVYIGKDEIHSSSTSI